MKLWAVLLSVLLTACGDEQTSELFCEGTVKKVTYNLGDYVIDFCEGSQCVVSSYKLKPDGIPSGRIQIYFVQDGRRDRDWFQAEHVPGEPQDCKKTVEQIMADAKAGKW